MAFGNATFSDAGGAVSDLFASAGAKYKAQGDRLEGDNYRLASTLALQNEEFTKESTAVKEMQTQRQLYMGLGTTEADVAGSGFAKSGSALDLLREGAQQGALTKQVVGQQGLITEAGYDEQAKAFTNMASAADLAAQAEENASKGSLFSGILKGAASLATLFTGVNLGGLIPSGGGSGTPENHDPALDS